MKRKAIIIGICALIAIGTIGVFASNTNIFNSSTQNNNIETKDDVDYSNPIAEAQSKTTFETDSIESIQPSNYEQMLAILNQTITDTDDFNYILIKYEYLKEVYKLSQDKLEYIADLIIQGCDAKTIIGLTYFWLDTDDDITVIKSMYDLKNEFEGKRNWYENAYDLVTNQENGSLSVEDVNAYYTRGLTPDDILTADVLCRKGVYTIQEILEAKIAGASFASISNAIDSGSSLYEPNMFSVDSISVDNAVTTSSVLDADELALLTDKSKKEILNEAVNGIDIEEELKNKRAEKTEQIRERLRNAGLLKNVDEGEVQ